ncbi:hypothetical protein KGQ27_03670 [Patescibacteria group bacterium]|nr:hypothetical protein [Patescibacteria group bacterium]MDE1946939.1 hypothetical protein [Patescibacteria group bacterium]MDE2233490.1 hypothetical protein [Patescibacteria group bacterium]
MKKAPTMEAVVTSVTGRKGNEYVVTKLTPSSPRLASLPAEATVTFSLSEWDGKHAPRPGQLVCLADIERFTKGWRARSASPVRA